MSNRFPAERPRSWPHCIILERLCRGAFNRTQDLSLVRQWSADGEVWVKSHFTDVVLLTWLRSVVGVAALLCSNLSNRSKFTISAQLAEALWHSRTSDQLHSSSITVLDLATHSDNQVASSTSRDGITFYSSTYYYYSPTMWVHLVATPSLGVRLPRSSTHQLRMVSKASAALGPSKLDIRTSLIVTAVVLFSSWAVFVISN